MRVTWAGRSNWRCFWMLVNQDGVIVSHQTETRSHQIRLLISTTSRTGQQTCFICRSICDRRSHFFCLLHCLNDTVFMTTSELLIKPGGKRGGSKERLPAAWKAKAVGSLITLSPLQPLSSPIPRCMETKLFLIYRIFISLQQLTEWKGLDMVAGKVICLPIDRAIWGYGLDSLLDLTRPIQLACQVWQPKDYRVWPGEIGTLSLKT